MSEPDYDFLQNEAPEEVAPEPIPEVAEEVVETVDKPPETPAIAEPTPAPPVDDRVPLAALKAERDKRQKLEREMAALRQQPMPPAFHEQPEQYVQQTIQQVRQDMTQTMYAALEDQARETYPDYDEVFEEVQAYAEENHSVIPQIFNSPNPAKAAYKLGKQLRELKQMQDPDAYRSKIEAEVRAKIEKEYADKEAAKQKAADAVPPDLTAVRASKDSEVLPDDSLDSILRSKR
ncbi:hypothetical protein IP90_00945 [Luteimonas cucumeris]|uniref:Uncharacterized protein n=1 Tax=Luteimonas cucumeris TaxID=985012 RepID=A0A562LAX3_9GAMM|nr:hypothetical protein [Luteimonas cucumeris]TWI04807.1 hypothetical protein IP90_00945 [Luteimonas cucumeris]